MEITSKYYTAKKPVFQTLYGVGVEPGTVIVADAARNDKLETSFEQVELGEVKVYPAYLDKDLAEEDKMAFLRRAYELGVRNIEMEAVAFAAFCLRAGIPAAIVCATLLDRLKGDQVTSTQKELEQFSDNAQQVVLNYIRRRIEGVGV